MTRSRLSPEQFANANSFESRTVTVGSDSVTFIVEKMTNGNAKIRACWNQKQVTEIDPSETECTVWEFDEWVLSWVPSPTFIKDGVTVTTRVMKTVTDSEGNEIEVPDEDATRVNVADFIAVNAVEIAGYAKDAFYLTKL
ncbi:MAG: hypothetical protein ABFC34_00255 [Methanobacterium sp.]